MPVGDAAAAAGIPVVPSTKDLRLGYIDINAVADALAARESALNTRALALEAATLYVAGTPTYLNGWSDAGTKIARVGKVVTLSVRVTRVDSSFGSGTILFSVAPTFRPAFAEVGTTGYLAGATIQLGPLTLASDGFVRFYFLNASSDKTITGTISFLAA